MKRNNIFTNAIEDNSSTIKQIWRQLHTPLDAEKHRIFPLSRGDYLKHFICGVQIDFIERETYNISHSN